MSSPSTPAGRGRGRVPNQDASPVVGSTPRSLPQQDTSSSTSTPVMEPAVAADAAQTLSAVQVKIPPFYPQDPTLWFLQVESQFITQRVTSERSKFHYVVGALQPDTVVLVRDLLLNPPAEEPYTQLKQQLIQRTSTSSQQRIQQLLSAEELGDQKPSHLLRRLQQLAGDTPVEASFLRELFLQRLPSQCRLVLAASQDTDVNNLATLADRIMEVMPPQLRPVTSPPAAEEPNHLAELRSEIAALREELHSMPRRGRSRSRPRSSSPASRSGSAQLCWYHLRYGDKARKCTSPCARQPSESSNSQASR